MDIQQLTERIGFLIGKDDLKTAIKEMSHVLQNSPKLNELIVQSARFTDLMSQIRMGTIKMDDANITKNQIRFGLLDLIRELESNENDPEVQSEISALKMPSAENIIQQTHSGSGDNVGGDKIMNS